MFGSFPIFVPKIIEICGDLTKFWQKQICLVFLGHGVYCWKWTAEPFSRYLLTRRVTQLLVGVWPSYLSPRSAGSLTAQTLNSLDNTCHCLSRYTRAESCRPRAVIGRQRLSLRSSQQWARTAQVSPVKGRVTDRAPTTTVRALRDDAGPQNDADGWGRRSGRFGTTWRFTV